MISAGLGVGTTVGSLTPGQSGFLRLEDLRIEQVQAVALLDLAVEQLFHALFHLGGIGVRHGHHILGCVAVAQAGPPAHLDEGGEARPDHAGFGLVERPGVDHGIQACMRGLALEFVQFGLPVFFQIRKRPHPRWRGWNTLCGSSGRWRGCPRPA